MNESKKRVLEIKSVQVSPIRNTITALKDVLTDASITFTKQGLKIINFDKATLSKYINYGAQPTDTMRHLIYKMLNETN